MAIARATPGVGRGRMCDREREGREEHRNQSAEVTVPPTNEVEAAACLRQDLGRGSALHMPQLPARGSDERLDSIPVTAQSQPAGPAMSAAASDRRIRPIRPIRLIPVGRWNSASGHVEPVIRRASRLSVWFRPTRPRGPYRRAGSVPVRERC